MIALDGRPPQHYPNKMRHPTNEECSNCAVTRVGDEIELALWHPQWGGYCSHALVTFGAEMPQEGLPCFEVANFHDGEFPGDKPTKYHYCDAIQLVRFGVEVAEAQLRHVTFDGEPARLDDHQRKSAADLAARLLRMCESP